VLPTKKDTQNRAAPFGPDMHQIVIGWGFAPDPTGGSLQYCPDPLAGLRGGAAGERVTREGRGKRRDRKGGEGLDERGSWAPRDFQMD